MMFLLYNIFVFLLYFWLNKLSLIELQVHI